MQDVWSINSDPTSFLGSKSTPPVASESLRVQESQSLTSFPKAEARVKFLGKLMGSIVEFVVGSYLEDHHMTCKKLATMVSKSIRPGVVPSPSKWPFHGLQMEVTKCRVILQAQQSMQVSLEGIFWVIIYKLPTQHPWRTKTSKQWKLLTYIQTLKVARLQW